MKVFDRTGITEISIKDEGYPSPLRDIYSPPLSLNILGSWKEEDVNSVAIVGARKCSFYGMETAERMAYELALRGITVISGMARGIDTAAHRGALKAGGRTIAVLGSGFGNIYPENSEKLVGEISASGAVITEFPFDMMPLKYNFPKRNRIISGLAKGVLVVEASPKSGSLITVDFALDQGKDVFAVPGRIDQIASAGTNRLIQNGAKLVMSVDDIVDELGISAVLPPEKAVTADCNGSCDGLGEDEKAVLAVLGRGNVFHIDEMIDNTGMDTGRLHKALLCLEFNGIVKALPGKRFEAAHKI